MAKQDITLVLGGGSALGLAHIGVIEVIEQHFNIKAIIGSSAGAVVGGLYLSGNSSEQIISMVKNLSLVEYVGLLRLGIGGNGLLDGKWLEKYFREKTFDKNIEDLEIDYGAIAFDVNNLETVIITKGPLCSAMRASSSLPLVFEPFHTEDRILMDGGVEYPLPIAFSKYFNLRRPVIAVNVLPEIGKRPKRFEITDYFKKKEAKESFIFTSLQSGIYNQASMALSSVLHFKPFMYIDANLPSYTSLDFKYVEKFYEHGKKVTKLAIANIPEGKSMFDSIREHLDNYLSTSNPTSEIK